MIGFTTMVEQAIVADEQFQRMERCGCKLSTELRVRITEVLDHYIEETRFRHIRPRPNAQIKKRLLSIAKHARSLAHLLEVSASKVSRTGVTIPCQPGAFETTEAIQDLVISYARLTPPLFQTVLHSMHHIAVGSRTAAEKISTGISGRKTDPEIIPLIRSLQVIFRQAGGKGCYTKDRYTASSGHVYKGRFFEFVNIAMEALPKKYRRQNSALGKIFEQARLSHN